jgi:hypothetical protein
MDRAVYRPKTRGELLDKLKAGVPCEVVSRLASMTDIMLRGWLEFEDYIITSSENPGWSIFVPQKKEEQCSQLSS